MVMAASPDVHVTIANVGIGWVCSSLREGLRIKSPRTLSPTKYLLAFRPRKRKRPAHRRSQFTLSKLFSISTIMVAFTCLQTPHFTGNMGNLSFTTSGQFYAVGIDDPHSMRRSHFAVTNQSRGLSNQCAVQYTSSHQMDSRSPAGRVNPEVVVDPDLTGAHNFLLLILEPAQFEQLHQRCGQMAIKTPPFSVQGDAELILSCF